MAAAFSTNDVVALPACSSVLARVVSAKAAGHFISAAELSLEVMSVRLPEPNGRGEDVGIMTEYLSSDGKGRATNTMAKAGGGGSRRCNCWTSCRRGNSRWRRPWLRKQRCYYRGQIELHPETLLRFRTAAPLTTTVYKKNGVQIQLPASSGPALLPRAASGAQTE
jgi:hypothetical protein